MKHIKVIRPPKEKFSWTKEILKTEIKGEPMRIEDQHAKTVVPILSRDIKIKCPEFKYYTDSVSEPGYLLIYRTA